MPIPARIVGTKTGDCVVAGVATEVPVEGAGAREGAAAAPVVVRTVAGGWVAMVLFWPGVAVPVAALVAGGTGIEVAVVTTAVPVGVAAGVATVVVVSVGATVPPAETAMACTGTAVARANRSMHKRIRCNERHGVIGVHWMPQDMRIMGTAG